MVKIGKIHSYSVTNFRYGDNEHIVMWTANFALFCPHNEYSIYKPSFIYAVGLTP